MFERWEQNGNTGAILAHRNWLAAQGERGTFRASRELDDEVFSQAATQRALELRNALSFTERNFLNRASHGDRRAGHCFRPADGQVHGIAGTWLPNGDDFRLARLKGRL